MTKVGRNVYFDVLRSVAIIRVILYHTLGFGWLTVVFPSMGVMFALGGSLMAASLNKGSARSAVYSRCKRLLPALWVFGALVVPLMMLKGWSPDYRQLALWIFPISDPPASDYGMDGFVRVLWYVRAYLWFVLLSPLLLLMFRRAPAITLLLPLSVLVVNSLGYYNVDGRAGAVISDLTAFGTCWCLGFAHRDGFLYRASPWTIYPLAFVSAGGAALWVKAHLGVGEALDLSNFRLANTLWSIAFVLVLFRIRPQMQWVNQNPQLQWILNRLNARAVTVYLWHSPAILLGNLALSFYGLKDLQPWGVVILILVGVLVAFAVLMVGWVEDLGASKSSATLQGRHRYDRLTPWHPTRATE